MSGSASGTSDSAATATCSSTDCTSRSASARNDKLCLLVVIGVCEDGEKELLAVEDGYRESTDSWPGAFRDMKHRGLNCPKLVVGDGALGA